MRITFALFFFLISTLSLDSPSMDKGWRGIIPLHSTRADVERLLGKGTDECKCGYYLNDMNIFFKYSPGDCRSGRGGWDVPLDTVVWITIYPKPNPRLSDLNIDETKFKKRQGAHIQEFYYENEEEGLTLEVYDDRVQSFLYGPAQKDKHLRCPDNGQADLSDVPKEFRAGLMEMLNRFVEYSRTEQYEKQYELFLPEIAAKMFPVKGKEEYGRWVRNSQPFKESWVELKLDSVTGIEDKVYGKVYLIYVRAKTLEAGKIVESSRITKAIIKHEKWYLINSFWLAPS